MIMSQPNLSLEAELHDSFWAAEDDASEVALMADFLRKHPGPALEIGCGSGRLMFPLLADGFEIEGLELSPDMLRLARSRARTLGLKPSLHPGDMSSWQAPRRYAALLAPAFTLQLSAEPGACLRHWHGLLENQGGLYLTVFMPYAELLGDLPEDAWYPDHQSELPDGGRALLETRHRLDREHRFLLREHRYSIEGPAPAQYESSQTIRWIEHSEMLEILESSGFRLDRYFPDFDPRRAGFDPDRADFDGILTYQARRSD